MNTNLKSEKTAEAFASAFLEEVMSHDLFIGSYIERLLANYVHVIYQFVEDSSYYGAAVTHQNGQQFVSLNTYHPLRARYFTAAHELWHLTEGSMLQDENFNHERAADRFAAAIMMPAGLTKTLWQKFKKQYNEEEAVIFLADLAEVPYVSVVRRIRELTGSAPFLKREEKEWVTRRYELGFPSSGLDQARKEQRFIAYEKVVKESVEQYGLDPLTAANKLADFAPDLAERYQRAVLDKGKSDEA